MIRFTKKLRTMMTNTRTKALLSRFIQEKVQETKFKDIIASSKLMEDILIEELNKNSIVSNGQYLESNTRNIDLIMYSLDHLKEFYLFKLFNNLNNKDISLAANYFKHAHYNKGEYIFCYHEKSNKFYGIIKGKVSIRGIKYITNSDFKAYKDKIDLEFEELVYYDGIINDSNLQTIIKNDDSFNDCYLHKKPESADIHKEINQLRYELEFERVVFSPGMCLGEWGIIDNVPRSASVYCKEDTDVFYCDKDPFIKYLAASFLQSTTNKRMFLNKALPGLAKYFVNIVPLFFHKNNLICSQFDVAEYIYIVYQGECSYIKIDHLKSKDDLLLRKNEWKVLYILQKGSILGLEALHCKSNSKINRDGNDKRYYEHNLIASKDFTAVYRISINLLNELNYDYNEYLKKIHTIHENRLTKAKEMLNVINRETDLTSLRQFMSHENVIKSATSALKNITEQIKLDIQSKNAKQLKVFRVFNSNDNQSSYNRRITIKPQQTHDIAKSLKSLTFNNKILHTMHSTIKAMDTIATKRDCNRNQDCNIFLTRPPISTQENRSKSLRENTVHKPDKQKYYLNNTISPNNTNYQSDVLLTLQNTLTTTNLNGKIKKKVQIPIPIAGSSKLKNINIRHQFILGEIFKTENIQDYSSIFSRTNGDHSYYNSGIYDMPLLSDILNNSSK